MTTMSSVRRDEFVHPALFYRSDAEYLDGLVPFITEGLDAGQPVAVAVPGPRVRLLGSALGSAADRVSMFDMTVVGRNPGRIIAGVLRRFADARAGRHVRIVGEPIWPGRSAVEYPACAQHEALINAAFTGRDVTIVCPYDVAGLDTAVIADARATHPLLWEGDHRYPSAEYAPDSLVARYNLPLDDAGAEVEAHHVAVGTDLAPVRKRIAHQARLWGLAAARVADLELITTELATNSLLHAGTPCEVRVWVQDGDLVCECRDAGRLTDPLAGRRPADPENSHGRGLLLINDLADLVRVHAGPRGTTIRAYFRLGRQPPRLSDGGAAAAP